MKTFIYKGTKKQGTFLYIENMEDFSRVPEELLDVLGQLSYVMRIELSTEKKLAQADVNQVMNELKKNGYYLQMPVESDKLFLADIKPNSNPIPSL